MLDLPENEMFSAYVDGELTGDEQAEVERILAESPDARQLVDELRSLSVSLQSLPAYQVKEDLAVRVLRQAEREMLSEPAAPLRGFHQVDTPAPKAERWSRRLLRPRNFAWSAMAIAVAIVLMLMEPSSPDPGASNGLADRTEIDPIDAGSVVEAVEQPTQHPVVAATNKDPDSEGGAEAPSPAAVAAEGSETGTDEGVAAAKTEAPVLILQCQLAEGQAGHKTLVDVLDRAGVVLEAPLADDSQAPVELSLTTTQIGRVIAQLQSSKDQVVGYSIVSPPGQASPRIPVAHSGDGHTEQVTSSSPQEAKETGGYRIEGTLESQPRSISSADMSGTASSGGGASKATIGPRSPADEEAENNGETLRVQFVLEPAKRSSADED